MDLYNSNLYLNDIKELANLDLDYQRLKNKSILVTGACGLIGSFMIDTIMYLNEHNNLNCHIYGMGINLEKGRIRFQKYLDNKLFDYLSHDVNLPLDEIDINFDYIIHLASNTHPKLYATKPISTITTNVIGTNNLLDYASKHQCTRFIFASSNEIYGENRGDTELFNEEYLGYINSNTLRAGYPESKRCGEALCQAYLNERELDVVIARFTRTYGPTMLKDDTKAISQFINKALDNEDIVLKSEGKQYYSFTYVFDAVYGLFIVLLNGITGEAYNISNPNSDITLKDLATLIANSVGRKVVFELPDEIESKGFSKATKARLDNTKITGIGYKPVYDIKKGVERTINILKEIRK
ncbi:MAG: NAD-dependent epimerase/dehydratase family protein [Bacilli bacterium]|nr:NAD-dependent epimerase/dehydratase family protein [Bacilli bacterium]